jgi:cell division control protein 7
MAPPPSSSSSSSPPSFYSSSRSSSASISNSFLTKQNLTPPGPNAEQHKDDVLLALDLVDKLLNPDATKRPTPQDALKHPFLSEEDEGIDDDDYFPHPFGGGVCGEWHFLDDATDEPCVRIKLQDGTMSVRKLMAGEGLAIGRRPCEFHTNDFDVF